MKITDEVIKLIKTDQYNDGNFKKLEDALDTYHRLIRENKLIPRKNNVQHMYIVHPVKSNA